MHYVRDNTTSESPDRALTGAELRDPENRNSAMRKELLVERINVEMNGPA